MDEHQALNELLAAINPVLQPSSEESGGAASAANTPTASVPEATIPAPAVPVVNFPIAPGEVPQFSHALPVNPCIQAPAQLPPIPTQSAACPPQPTDIHHLLPQAPQNANQGNANVSSLQHGSSTEGKRPVATHMLGQPGPSSAAFPQQLPRTGSAANPNKTAGFSREQLENAKAIHRQQAANAVNAARKVASQPAIPHQLPATPGYATGTVNQAASSSSLARGQAQRVCAGASASSQPQSQGNPQSSTSRIINHEQIIVGFFCRHAIKTLNHCMGNDPRATQAEALLKEHIKAEWARWVRRQLSRTQLLESIAARVRNSCEAASGIDLVNQFRIWYQREYQLQEQRAINQGALQRRALAQSRSSAQSSICSRRPAGPAPTNSASTGQAVGTAGHRTTTLQAQGQCTASAVGNRVPSNSNPGTQAGAGSAVPGKSQAGRGTGRARGRGRGKGRSRGRGRGHSAAGSSIGKSAQQPSSAGSINDTELGKGTTAQQESVAPRGITSGVAATVDRDAGAGRIPEIGKGPEKSKIPPTSQERLASAGSGSAKSAADSSNTGTLPTPATGSSEIGKRPLDQSGDLHEGPQVKRTKVPAGRKKGSVTGKKQPGTQAANSLQNSNAAPPVSDFAKRQAKKPKREDNSMGEFSVVNNIIDIEDEEDNLGTSGGEGIPEPQAAPEFGSDMLLGVPRLRAKMKAMTDKFNMEEGFSNEAMETISHAVRERLTNVIESLRLIADVRTEKEKQTWNVQPTGPDVYDTLMKMRLEEERSLKMAAEARVKLRKEQKEQEEKKLAKEKESNEKNEIGANSKSDMSLKEKLTIEKKRKEQESHRNALSAIIRDTDERRKKARIQTKLEPLDLDPKRPPPILLPLNTGGTAGSSFDDGKIPDPLQKLNSLEPLVKLGRANDPRNAEPAPQTEQVVAKRALKLQDCLYLWRNGRNTRGSTLLFKWSARLGSPRPF